MSPSPLLGAIQDRLAADSSRAARLAQAAGGTDEHKVTELYQLAYARSPQPGEMRIALDYLERRTASAKPGKDAAETEAARLRARREGYEDTVWALVNTKEFLFNH